MAGEDLAIGLLLPFALLLVIVIVIFVFSGVKIVQPYEQAIYMRLGKYVRVLNQGLNFVSLADGIFIIPVSAKG